MYICIYSWSRQDICQHILQDSVTSSFVKPHRTPTNIRYYDDKMIVKALRFSTLVNAGFKISILNKLSAEQIDDLIDKQLKNKNQTNKYSLYISQILESSILYLFIALCLLFSQSYKFL